MHSLIAAARSQPSSRVVSALVVLAALVAFLVRVHEVWSFTVDDAFISFRYSESLAAGRGLRFSAHAEPVEGFTSPAWVAIGALFLVCGLDVVVMSKLAGVAACLGTSFLLWRTFQSWWPEWKGKPLAALPPAMFLWHPDTAVHAVSGMETALHALLVVALALCFVRLADDPRPHKARTFALVGLALGLTRPDGNLLVLVSTAALAWANRGRSQRWLRPWLGWYVLPGACYFLLRAWYFGHWLPAPFHVKVLLDDLPGDSGRVAVGSFCWNNLSVVGLAACALPALRLVPTSETGDALRGARAAFSLGIALFVAFYFIPRHIMGYNHRFLFPILPMLLLLAAFGLTNVYRWLTRLKAHELLAVCITALPVAWYFTDFTLAWTRVRFGRLAYQSILERGHVPFAERLRAIDPSGRSIVAVQDAGAIPFISGWNSIDLCGLNDETIAFSGLDTSEIAARQVDVVVLNSRQPREHVHWDWDHELYEKYLARGFERVATVKAKKRYFLLVLARPGTAAHRQLRRLEASAP